MARGRDCGCRNATEKRIGSPVASSPPEVVERVLDERFVPGFGRYDGLLRGTPVYRAIPALAPLPGLPHRPGRLLPARLPAPPHGLLPRPVLDRGGGNGLQLRHL